MPDTPLKLSWFLMTYPAQVGIYFVSDVFALSIEAFQEALDESNKLFGYWCPWTTTLRRWH